MPGLCEVFALVMGNILQAMRGDGGDRGRGGGGKAAAASVDIRMHVRKFVQMYLHTALYACTDECVCMCNIPLALSPSHYPLSTASASIFTKYRALAVTRRQAWLQLRILELR